MLIGADLLAKVQEMGDAPKCLVSIRLMGGVNLVDR